MVWAPMSRKTASRLASNLFEAKIDVELKGTQVAGWFHIGADRKAFDQRSLGSSSASSTARPVRCGTSKTTDSIALPSPAGP
jgi:hypothetical protein